jgi:hypothetical protein
MVADLPGVSAIITNWNYAPYLAAAIDSVLGQTLPVHQCIVVDDGSTDGSRAIIKGYGKRITPLFRANGGQAAAFNSGFAVATGDIILFLDADDVLKPEAVATIVTAWHDDLAGISFGMEVIDRRGHASGLLPVQTRDIDNRPLLTEVGAFTFMPTSGNAFARRVVGAAFPMPETRWKISADAYLLRVAALAGRILPLLHVLAQYRVHEANNYYRVGAAKLWANRRDLRDIVDLARFFSSNSMAAGNLGLSKGERLAWQTAALRFGVILVQLGDRSVDLGEDLRRMAKMVMGMPAPLWARLATSAGLLLASAGWWRNRGRITWLQPRQDRPRWLESLALLCGRSRVWDPLRPDRRPRWRSPTPVGRVLATDLDPEADEALSGDISRPRFNGAPVIGGNKAYLDIELAPTPLPLSVEIGLVTRGDPALTIGVDASVDGELMEQTSVTGEGTVVVPLPRNTAAWGGAVRIHLRTRAHDSPWARFRPGYWLSVPTRLAVATVAVKPLAGALDPPAALPQRPLPATMYVEQNSEGWRHLDAGAIEMRGRAATLRFAGIDRGASLMVVINPGKEQPAGWMHIDENGARLFEGRWDGAGRITLELPPRPLDEYWLSAVEFRFSPDDPLEGRKPIISTVDFLAEGPEPARHPRSGGKGPLLNAGQQLTLFETTPGAKALGPQFTIDNEGSASLSGLGEIEFRIVPGTVDAQLQLDISQPFGASAGKVQVITVLSDDAVLAQVGLNGSTTLAVPLDPLVRRGKTALKLSLVSVYLELSTLSDPTLQTDIPAPAPLLLNAMELEGQRPPVLPGHLRPAPGSSIDGLLSTVRETLGGALAGQQPAELLRTRLVAMFEGSDLRAMLSMLADRDAVTRLAALGKATGPPEEGDVAFSCVSRLREATELPQDRADAVRHVMLALLTLPASAVPALADLAAIPAPFHWYPEAIAAYLGDDPALLTDVDNSGYEAFLTRLVASIDAGLTRPPGTPQFVLAVATLKALRPHYLLFGAGNCKPLLQSLGRAIERHLVLSGRTLARAFLPAPRTGPRRVGVMLRTDRAGPEGMIVSAMLRGLDPDQFTPVLILLEREPDSAGSLAVTCETIELCDLGVDAAVARIREARLDIFVLGSFFIGLDNLAAIVAHKLAPVQLATTAISPVTTGLSSFDAMISSPLLDAEAAGDYVEPLLLAEGQIQGFDRPLPDSGGQLPDLTRRLLGLPLDTVIFASGAMMRKIGEPLMTAWARILAHTPDSVLVLYPFAANWDLDYAPARFRQWAVGVLARFGVAPDRLIIRTNLGAEDVSRLLAVSDVYLDSFPYAGATTVTEALDVGLPVVALKGGHQRGRQGSAWLQAWGMQADAAPSVDTYVRRAVKLGTDVHLYDDRRRRIRAVSPPPHRDLAALGRTLGDALIAADGGEKAPIARRQTTYRYLFHHMPKAAGTSSRKVLRQWFSKLHPDYRPGWQKHDLQTPVDLKTVGPGELVLGHFELPVLRISRRYPEIYNGGDWRMFSIVREPLDMALSNYFFEHHRRADDPAFRPISLSASLRRTNKSAYCLHFNCNEKNWREVLNHYWFIGTMERLEESLGYIARELDRPMVDIPWENTTPRPMEPDVEDVRAYLRLNELDYEIYNEICRRLEKRLTEQGA